MLQNLPYFWNKNNSFGCVIQKRMYGKKSIIDEEEDHYKNSNDI